MRIQLRSGNHPALEVDFNATDSLDQFKTKLEGKVGQQLPAHGVEHLFTQALKAQKLLVGKPDTFVFTAQFETFFPNLQAPSALQTDPRIALLPENSVNFGTLSGVQEGGGEPPSGVDLGGDLGVLEGYPPIDLGEVFANLELSPIELTHDQEITSPEAANDPRTYLHINPDNGSMTMTHNFKEALEALHHLSPNSTMLEGVLADLRTLGTRMLAREENPTRGLEHLTTFIEYQVYKTGAHLKTQDEDAWTQKIGLATLTRNTELPGKLLDATDATLLEQLATQALKALGFQSDGVSMDSLQSTLGTLINDPEAELPQELTDRNVEKDPLMDVIRRACLPVIAPEIEKNYMARMRYSQPAPTLIRRDIPEFVRARLRVEERDVALHIFDTRSGVSVAFDPNRLDLDPTAKHTLESIAAHSPELADFLKEYDLNSKTIDLAPFDSAKFMIANVQVPVMDDGITICVKDKNNEPLSIKLGNSPEEVGIKMTNEPAGVYKRSLNSQRVVEIADWKDDGTKVVFQLKGSGVPAYGFSEDPNWSGGEYLALNIERGAMAFYDFCREVFDRTDVVPEMLGVSMVTNPHVASNEESVGRLGAVSCRLDTSMGVRLSNVTHESVADDLIALLSLATDDTWKREMIDTLGRNMAITNLFGLQYNDSGVDRLVDIGLQGEFSDSGGLYNLDNAPELPSMAVRNGIGRYLPLEKGNSQESFDLAYASQLMNALKQIGGREDTPRLVELRETIAREIPSPLEQVQFFVAFFAGFVGEDTEATALQRAFLNGGVAGYAAELADQLEDKVESIADFRAERLRTLIKGGDMEGALLRYNIQDEATLARALGHDRLDDDLDAQFKFFVSTRKKSLLYPCGINNEETALNQLTSRVRRYDITTEAQFKEAIGIGGNETYPSKPSDKHSLGNLVDKLKERGVLS